FDAALDAARQELDLEARTKLYGDLQKILWEEGGTLIPFHEASVRAISSKVSGLPDVAFYAIRFQDVTKSE
ncbi:MAG: peptide ABC transporter substrate-binding protein, partial [Pseudomonadota bacterium]